MIRAAKKFYTQEECLAFERQSSEKHENYQGEIFNKAGAGFSHNKLQKNFIIEVGSFLKGKSCDVYGSDLKIHIPVNTLYTYPDAAIVCAEPESFDDENDIALNPVVIAEILSKSTQSYDRGDKFMLYRSIETLQEYILIDLLSVQSEHYTKQQNGTWILKEINSLTDSLAISTIGYTLSLTELYNGVSF